MSALNNNEDPSALAFYQEDLALDLIRDGADAAQALVGNLPKANAEALSRHPIVAVGHALLVHLEAHADEQYQQAQALIEELQAIRESVNALARRPDSDNSGDKPQLAAEQLLSDYERLKELLELARSTLTDPDYDEALTRLQRLAGV